MYYQRFQIGPDSVIKHFILTNKWFENINKYLPTSQLNHKCNLLSFALNQSDNPVKKGVFLFFFYTRVRNTINQIWVYIFENNNGKFEPSQYLYFVGGIKTVPSSVQKLAKSFQIKRYEPIDLIRTNKYKQILFFCLLGFMKFLSSSAKCQNRCPFITANFINGMSTPSFIVRLYFCRNIIDV